LPHKPIDAAGSQELKNIDRKVGQADDHVLAWLNQVIPAGLAT